jgi:hypothetical protein
MNLSTTNAALSCNLDNRNFAYLTAAQRNRNLDFTARTYAMSTTCAPASTICNLQQSHACYRDDGCPLGLEQMSLAMTYNCGPVLSGNLNNGTGFSFSNASGSSSGASSNIGFFIQLFRKQGFEDPIGVASGEEATPNPFYFTVGAAVSTSAALEADPEAIEDDQNDSRAIMFNCTSTIYELRYTSINQSVAAGTYTKANETLSNNMAWTIFNAQSLTWNSLESAFLSGAQRANTSAAFADFFAGEFSRSMISMIAGITDARSNIAEQLRETRLVTRLPKAPFFTLIVLNLLFAVLGFILAIVAFASQPKRTRDIQARLSIAGLVAALLESDTAPRTGKSSGGIEGVFAEYYTRGEHKEMHRVAIVDEVGDNRVFEKVSAESAKVDEKPSVVASGDESNSHGTPPAAPVP